MQCWSARMMQNEGKKTLPEPNRQRTKDGFLMGFFLITKTLSISENGHKI